MIKLQNVVFPNLELSNIEELYYRNLENSWYSYLDKKLSLRQGGRVSFNTYFNSFSIGKWKDNTFLENLSINFMLDGHVQCYIYHLSSENQITLIKLQEFSADKTLVSLQIPLSIKDGLVYFEIKALSETNINDAFWATNSCVNQKVKLGLVITTFNRHEEVTQSVSRITKFLDEKQDIDVHLTIVDNGRNLVLNNHDKMTVLSNPNLGGAGGFARGLYSYKEQQKGYTHCLFMDDDAACETESIYRTYRFLELSKNPNIAISGSLINNDNPHSIYESGGSFKTFFHPLKNGLNLLDVHQVLENERHEKIDYGGWWYFAFPIKNAQYPFPFFVRGDDVNYGLQKQFEIISLNGVCTWGEDFILKQVPQTSYLDIRSLFLNSLQTPKPYRKNDKEIIKLVINYIKRYIYMYRYDTAELAILGVKDVLKGPSFFEENVSMIKIFERNKKYNLKERQRKLNHSDFNGFRHSSRNKGSRIFKKITLNGNLLPKTFFRSSNLIVPKWNYNRSPFFRRKKVMFLHSESQEGYIVEHDKRKFLELLKECNKLKRSLKINLKNIRQEYLSQYDYLTSKEYWEKQFFVDNK